MGGGRGLLARLEAKPHKRGATVSFKEPMDKEFEKMAHSAVTARVTRTDETAPTAEQFKAAVKAFWTALAS